MATGSITSSGMFRAGMRLEIGKDNSGLTHANVQRLMTQMRNRYPQAEFELRLIEKDNRVFLEALRQNKRTISKDAKYKPGSGDRLQQRDQRRQAAVNLLIRTGLITAQQAGLASGQSVKNRFGSDANRAQYMRELAQLVSSADWSPARGVPVQSRPLGPGGVPLQPPPQGPVVQRALSDRLVSGHQEPPQDAGMNRMSGTHASVDLNAAAPGPAGKVRDDMNTMFDRNNPSAQRNQAARRIVEQFAASPFGDEQAQELAVELKARMLSLTQEDRQALPLSIRMLAAKARPAEWQGMAVVDENAERVNEVAVEAALEVKAALKKVGGAGAVKRVEDLEPHRLLDGGRFVTDDELREAIRRDVDHSRLVVLNPAGSGGTEVAERLKAFATAHFGLEKENRPVVLMMSVRDAQHWVSLVAYKQASGALGYVAVDTDVNPKRAPGQAQGGGTEWVETVRQALSDAPPAPPVNLTLVGGDLQEGIRGNGCGPLQLNLFKRLSQADASKSVEDVAREWVDQTQAARKKAPEAAGLQNLAWRGQLFEAVAQQAAKPDDGVYLNDLYSPEGRPDDDLRPLNHPDRVREQAALMQAAQDSELVPQSRPASSEVAPVVVEQRAPSVKPPEEDVDQDGLGDDYPEVEVVDGSFDDGDPMVLDVDEQDLQSHKRSWQSNRNSLDSQGQLDDDPLNHAVDMDDQQAENLRRTLLDSGMGDSRILSGSVSDQDMDRLLMTHDLRQAVILSSKKQ